MTDNSEVMRITVKLSTEEENMLGRELAKFRPYHRSKQLVRLALIGLTMQRMHLQASNPNQTPAFPSEIIARAQADSESIPSAQSLAATSANEVAHHYSPLDYDLSELWESDMLKY